MNPHLPPATRARGRLATRRQRGVIMLVTLLALVIMLIGAVALVRSFNSSLFMAGNLAFKRDLVNQAERAAAVVLTQLDTGALSTVAARSLNTKALNYRAVMLGANPGEVNDQGIPNALLSDAAFDAVGVSANDIVIADQGIRIRYVIDRLCNLEGNEETLGATNCSVGLARDAFGGSASTLTGSSGGGPVRAPQTLGRLSVRVDGPRNTQAFFQTTFALRGTI